jgi:hypothetical protein
MIILGVGCPDLSKCLPTTRELMQEGWKELSQDWINAQVDTMVDRLKDCLDPNKADEDMTGY